MEPMVTVLAIGTLFSMMFPNYYQLVTRIRENEATLTIAQMQTNIEADVDAAS